MNIETHLTADTPPISNGGVGYPVAEFDAENYRHHLEEFDLTQDQQNELLETLWHIMSTMVDIGWGVDNVQRMIPELFNHESHAVINKEIEKTRKDVSDAK